MSLVHVHDIDGKSYSVDSAELIFNPAVYGVVIRDGQVLLLPTNGRLRFRVVLLKWGKIMLMR